MQLKIDDLYYIDGSYRLFYEILMYHERFSRHTVRSFELDCRIIINNN